MAKEWIDCASWGHSEGIAWFTSDSGEGAWLGQQTLTSSELDALLAEYKARRDFIEYEYYYVERTVARAIATAEISATRGVTGWHFEDKTQRKKALALARAARTAAKREFDTYVAWPGWAQQALAAGWKPPKGWKP